MKSKTDKQKVGETGENVACKFLMKHGFEIIERNYRKKWGEIDIIAKKSGILRFIEVKTVSCENLDNVIRETNDSIRPEENVHPWKLKRLSRVIQSYLLEKSVENKGWQLDILSVFLDLNKKQAKIRFLENIVI